MPIHAPQITEFDSTRDALAASLGGRLHDGDVVHVPAENAIGVTRGNLVYALTVSAGRCFYVASGPEWEDYSDSIEVADQIVQRDGLVLHPSIETIAAALR